MGVLATLFSVCLLLIIASRKAQFSWRPFWHSSSRSNTSAPANRRQELFWSQGISRPIVASLEETAHLWHTHTYIHIIIRIYIKHTAATYIHLLKKGDFTPNQSKSGFFGLGIAQIYHPHFNMATPATASNTKNLNAMKTWRKWSIFISAMF